MSLWHVTHTAGWREHTPHSFMYTLAWGTATETDKVLLSFCCSYCQQLFLFIYFFIDINANVIQNNIINAECGLLIMHNTTSIPTLLWVVLSQNGYVLTSNYVLYNSKWECGPICQYCFQPTSPNPLLPLQFKGKERGRWAQLAEISQNK